MQESINYFKENRRHWTRPLQAPCKHRFDWRRKAEAIRVAPPPHFEIPVDGYLKNESRNGRRGFSEHAVEANDICARGVGPQGPIEDWVQWP